MKVKGGRGEKVGGWVGGRGERWGRGEERVRVGAVWMGGVEWGGGGGAVGGWGNGNL